MTEEIAYIVAHKTIVTALHVLAMAVGVGAATVTDVFFFRFLRNFKISHEEARLMRVLSSIIWVALICAILTGLALYLTDPLKYNATPKFLAKMGVVLIIALNGALLNAYISPRLTHISFVHHPLQQIDLFRHFRRLAFASGAISIVSWYTALFLGTLRQAPFTLEQITLAYGAILIVAIIGSQIMERRFVRRARARHSA